LHLPAFRQWVTAAALCFTWAETRADGDSRSLHMGAFVDMGQVVKGSAPTLGLDKIDGLFLPRMGVSLTAEQVIDERLRLKTEVGGLFWYAVNADPGADHTRIIRFGPGIGEASFQYDFSPTLMTKGGFIPYKYNPDARNLGEYLFRSECYPSLVYTEGWSWLDNAVSQSLGWQLRWTLWQGAWTNDLLLISDMSEQPKWDFSPAFVTTLKIGKVAEFGAGISLHRWLPVQPHAESPDDSMNTYVEIDNFPSLPFIADTALLPPYLLPHKDHLTKADSIDYVSWRQLAFPGGTLKGNLYDVAQYRACPTCGHVLDSVVVTQRGVDGAGNPVYDTAKAFVPRVRRRYTFQGIKLMARFAFDLKPLFHTEGMMGPDEFRIFGEAAVLGLQDQPYYYDDVTARIPLMFGCNLPVFRLLDRASLQFEYFRNPWPDSKQKNYKYGLPVWDLERDLYARYVQLRDEGLYKDDDWKWSLNLVRTLTPGLKVEAQIANDHFRLRTWDDDLTFFPLTNRQSHWYYIVRLQWGV
jgi:hypothetical protein